MRVLFVGLGSIGCRHIKNLAAELRGRGIDFEIDALRSGTRPLPDDVAPLVSHEFCDISQLEKYDIAYITNPSSLHAETIKALVDIADAMFIEKPVFIDPATDISSLGLRPNGIYYVACPLRHSPVVRRAIEIAHANEVRAARAICSSYLPEWRKNGDYRSCYSARRDMGGGVELDLVHEWDYLTAAFGYPRQCRGFGGRYSALEITSDDVAVYTARYDDMLLSLHLDYIGRAARRELEIYCDDETYIADIIGGTIRHLRSGEVESFSGYDIYKNETKYFTDLVTGREKHNINTVENAAAVLALALSTDEDQTATQQ